MSRVCLSLAVLVLGGAATGAATATATTDGAPGSGSAPMVMPPALPALEQKMAQIRFNTARISSRFVLGELGTAAGGAELGSGETKGLVTVSTGVISFVPRLASSTSKSEAPPILGHSLVPSTASKERTIGNTTYTYTPSIARLDGGRPWVRGRSGSAPKATGKTELLADLLQSLAPTLGDSPNDPFGKLIGVLDHAVGIREDGPVVVDGQQTTAFTASLSVVQQLAGGLSPKQRATLEREVRAKPDEANIQLEVFIAADGLPVRTTGIFGSRLEGIGIEQDILALEVPVVVHAPPASQTIGLARSEQIERRQAKREQRRLARVRRCLRRRPRRGCAVRA